MTKTQELVLMVLNKQSNELDRRLMSMSMAINFQELELCNENIETTLNEISGYLFRNGICEHNVLSFLRFCMEMEEYIGEADWFSRDIFVDTIVNIIDARYFWRSHGVEKILRFCSVKGY